MASAVVHFLRPLCFCSPDKDLTGKGSRTSHSSRLDTKSEKTKTLRGRVFRNYKTLYYRGFERSRTPAGLEHAIPGSEGRCLIHWRSL